MLTPSHHNRFMALFRDHPGEPVPEENFWTLWYKGRLRESHTPTTWLGATPSGLTSAHLHHPPNVNRLAVFHNWKALTSDYTDNSSRNNKQPKTWKRNNQSTVKRQGQYSQNRLWQIELNQKKGFCWQKTTGTYFKTTRFRTLDTRSHIE